MGSVNSGHRFVNRVSCLLADLPITMEVDNMIAGGRNFKEAIVCFKEVLSRCRKHDIKLARSKLQFGITVKFVDMLLGGCDGYKPLPAKADAICQLEALKNVIEVWSLLGLLKSLRNFMSDLTQMMPNIRSYSKWITAIL